MDKICFAVLAVVLCAPVVRAQTAPPSPLAPAYTPLTGKERLRMYVSDTFGPVAWVRSGASAGISQLRDRPPEWPQGMRGYGYRFGSRIGRFAIEKTLELGAGVALGEDPRYFRCNCSGIWRRSWYAATHTLIARDRNGRERFAYARTASVFVAAGISVAWHPARYSVVGNGLQFGTVALGSRAGFNVLTEFWPDIRRKVFRRKR